MSSNKIKLQLDKLIELLHSHKYILSSVYCEDDEVRFAECRTPKYQKTFIIYVPSSYRMTCKRDSLKVIDIVLSEEDPTTNLIRFMTDMKGPLLECDLFLISSTSLCMYKNSGDITCYNIKGEEEEESPAEEEPQIEEEDEVTKLEKETAKILEQIDPTHKLPTPSPPKNETVPDETAEENPPEKTEEIPEESKDNTPEPLEEEPKTEEATDEEVELVFEDESGSVIDDVANTLENPPSVNTEDTLKGSEVSSDNGIPDDIENMDISLGMVYIVVPLGIFFKKVAKYEESVIDTYEQIDDNELDVRKDRLGRVKDITTDFLIHADKRLQEISEEEKNIKAQLLRLTVVLAQTEAMKKEANENTRKLGDMIPEVDRLYNKTRKQIHDVNIELLRLRDLAEEILVNYTNSIKELMEL